jgi:hypothetical protein
VYISECQTNIYIYDVSFTTLLYTITRHDATLGPTYPLSLSPFYGDRNNTDVATDEVGVNTISCSVSDGELAAPCSAEWKLVGMRLFGEVRRGFVFAIVSCFAALTVAVGSTSKSSVSSLF